MGEADIPTSRRKKIIVIMSLTSAATVLALAGMFALVYFQGKAYIRTTPERGYGVAVVFGAGLTRSGTPSPVLADRVEAGVQLYRDGLVTKLLLSGDNRFVEYNEPEAMKKLALSLGMPESDLVLDYAGRRTYDTCYRAQAIFGLDRAVLVTNEYHLPRALFTCRSLGLDVVGVASDMRRYDGEWSWQLREVPASIMAWWQSVVVKPEPILGPEIPIPITE